MKDWIVLRNFIALALLTALVLAVPVSAAALLYAARPNAYGDTYYAELPRKAERLAGTQGQRLVVIGGSATAFGIDSKLAERELGMPCVNFGLYAAFGLKPMLDLSLGRLNAGDIVVLMPETSQQMYSGYCGYDYLLKAFETRPGMLLGLGTGYIPGLLSKLPGYLSDAGELLSRGGSGASGVYALSSFDEWGDIVYPRDENVMEKGFLEDNLPELTPRIVTKEFLDMVNRYVRSARKRGAEVYFSFCPVNALSAKKADPAEREAFVRALREGLDCPLLSPLEDRILDAGYFYDSNYHLNDAGMKYNTLMLASDVQRVRGSMRASTEPLPLPPRLDRDGAVLSAGEQDGFLYEVTAVGAAVTGLDGQAKALRVLEVPDSLGGADVVSVASGAFSGSEAEVLILPRTLSRLPGGAFAGMEKLGKAALMAQRLPEVGDALLEGAADGLAIFVPDGLYASYTTDYFWGLYAAHIRALGSLSEGGAGA